LHYNHWDISDGPVYRSLRFDQVVSPMIWLFRNNRAWPDAHLIAERF
jgi:hypothetical protein